jgi:hypothetical protein
MCVTAAAFWSVSFGCCAALVIAERKQRLLSLSQKKSPAAGTEDAREEVAEAGI